MQAGAQGATNAVQGGAEQLNMNRAMINEDVKPDMNVLEGVATNALNEGFTGGVIGGVAGGALPGEARANTGGNQGVPLGGDTQTEGLGQPVDGGGQPQAPQQVQEGGTIQPGPTLSLQEAAEQIKAERGRYRGIDDDIRIAEEQGFDDEAAKLWAVKRNLELAWKQAEAGDGVAAERFHERANKIYREVFSENERGDPAERVVVGEYIEKLKAVGPARQRQSETIDQQPERIGRDTSLGIPPTVDAPFYMPPTEASQNAKAATERAFTEQQGNEPGLRPDTMPPEDIQFIPGENINMDQQPIPETMDVEELPFIGRPEEISLDQEVMPGLPEVEELSPVRRLPASVDAPYRMPASDGVLRARATTERAFTEQQGQQPGTFDPVKEDLTAALSNLSEAIARTSRKDVRDVVVDGERGRKGRVKVGNVYQPVTFKLVDLDSNPSLRPTIKKARNQFRDRTRKASDIQIADIAANLDFNELGDD